MTKFNLIFEFDVYWLCEHVEVRESLRNHLEIYDKFIYFNCA
jgi:hypothetical protein